MNDLLKLKFVMTIMIDCYYNFNKMKTVSNNSEKMIKIDMKKNINLDKSARKICLIFNVRFFIILIEIEIKRNIDFAYLYS